MDLTQMFLASPDWVKAMWVLCMTGLILGFPAVCALLVKTVRQPAAAPAPSGPVVTLLSSPLPEEPGLAGPSGLLDDKSESARAEPEPATEPATKAESGT